MNPEDAFDGIDDAALTSSPPADGNSDRINGNALRVNGNTVRINGNAVRVDGNALRANGNTAPADGRAVHDDGLDPGVEPVAGLEDVAWRPSYDRESVDRYLSAVEAEKRRLLAAIRLAEEREATAQERSQERAAERDGLLGTLLLAARAEIDRVEIEHREAVAAIHEQAEAEAAGIRDQAEAEAEAVREAVASLASIAGAGESMREAVASLTAITGGSGPMLDAPVGPADEADDADDPKSPCENHVG